MTHVQPLEPRRLLAGGTLDPSFGTGGVAVVRVPTTGASVNYESPAPSQLIADAAGRTLYLSTGVRRFTIGRLTAAGAIDTTFATPAEGNRLVFDTAGAADARVSIAVDAAGRIDLLSDDAIRRFTANGKLDRTFGTGGTFNFRAAGWTGRRFVTVNAITTDAAGRLWGVGAAYNRNGHTTVDGEPIAFRITADGKLDAAFGGGGVAVLDSGADGAIESVIRVLADGSGVVAMTDNTAIVSYKFTAAGKVDTSYGTKGRAENEAFSPDLYGIRADGRILATYYDATSGLKDGGNYPAAIDFGGDLEVAANGRTIYAATFRNVRKQSLGLDPLATEADGSKWVYDRPAYPSPALDGNYGVLYHVLASGKLDPAFNHGNGLAGAAATVAADGSIVAAVVTGDPDGPPTHRVSVARYFPDEGPLASTAPAVLAAPAATATFSLIWRDDDDVARSTLDNNDVVVRGGSFSAAARVTRIKTLGNGQTRVTYAVTGPGGAWDTSDNRTYTIATKAGAVKDTQGNANAARTAGTLTVTIA